MAVKATLLWRVDAGLPTESIRLIEGDRAFTLIGDIIEQADLHPEIDEISECMIGNRHAGAQRLIGRPWFSLWEWWVDDVR